MKKRLLFLFVLSAFLAGYGYAQTKTVTGKVTDSKDATPLSGATILSNGKTFGITGTDGSFSVKVPTGATSITISMLGYADETAQIPASNIVNVKLVTAETKALEEVVVTGYATKQKRANVGSASTINASTISSQPIGSFDQLLQGQVPGVNVKAGSGQPGRSADVVIRGKGSINGSNSPLYIVDGVEVRANDFSTMNSADFENFTILRDAASTAIYGSRGANGVIVITTKKGRSGKVKFSYDGQYGQSLLPENQLKLMNTQEKLDFEINIAGNPWGFTPAEVTELRKTNVNWDDYVFQKGSTSSHQLSASGGNEKTTFYTSVSMFNQEGVVINTNLKRVTGRLNLTHTESNVKFGVNLSGGTSSFQGTSEGDQSISSPLNTVIWALPYEAPYQPDGSYTNSIQFPFWLNPIEQLKENAGTSWQLKATGNVFMELKLPWINNLTYRINAGGDYSQIEGFGISNFGTQAALQNGALGNPVSAEGAVARSFDRRFRYTITNSLNYKTNLGRSNDHSLSVSVFNEFVNVKGRSFNYTGYGLLLPFRNEAGLVAGTAANGYIPVVGGGFPDNSALSSYFATADYAYKNRYFLSLTGRTDGSSRLSASNRWTTYGSVAAGWIISDESFFESMKAINFLKLKASYGTVGNQNGIGDFPYLQQYGRGTYNGGGTLQVSRLANNDLTWETRRTVNIGLDFELLKSRIRGSVEVYNGLTKGLYIAPFVPSTSGGGGTVLVNSGSMENKGIEATLGFKIFDTRDFRWNLDLNYSYNKNTITDLPDNQNLQLYGSGLALQKGKPFNSFYLVQYAGVNPANGNSQYIKADGKTITEVYDANDLVILGTSDAPHNAGLTNTFSYKGIELSAQLVASAGNYIYNNARFNVEFYQYTTSGFARSGLTAWTAPGQVTNFPRIDEATQSTTTRFLEKGDFWRLRNVTLAYSLPKTVTGKLGIQGARFYVQGQNLFTKFTLQGWDPEISSINGGDGETLGGSQYPALKTISVGLNVTF
jgi:TonB-linked SusC/RagA family outer membrane protein